jgi:flagellar capping protein FliD
MAARLKDWTGRNRSRSVGGSGAVEEQVMGFSTDQSGSRGRKVAVSVPSILTVFATEDASPGQHSVRVLGLAAAEVLGSRLFTSRTMELGLTGEFRVAGTRIELGVADSLNDTARRFNDVHDTTGVIASVLSTANGAYRLILTTRHPGAEGIDLVDGTAGVLQSLGLLDSTVTLKRATAGGARSDLFGDDTTEVGTLLGFTVTGPEIVEIGGVHVTLDLGTMSLSAIAMAINDAAAEVGSAVGASVVDDGRRLEIRSATAFADSGHALEALGILARGRRSQRIRAGADAEVEIDGIRLRASTNIVTGVIPGLTFQLDAAAPSTTVRVSVSDDPAVSVADAGQRTGGRSSLVGPADVDPWPRPDAGNGRALRDEPARRNVGRRGVAHALAAQLDRRKARLIRLLGVIDAAISQAQSQAGWLESQMERLQSRSTGRQEPRGIDGERP